MKRSLFLLFAVIVPLSLFGQKQSLPDYTHLQLLQICDSIIAEGNLLYKYEKAAWEGTDIAMENSSVRNEMVNYTVYEDGEFIKIFFINSDIECICEISFNKDDMSVNLIEWGMKELTETQKLLLYAKNDILNNIIAANDVYQLGVPDGFSLNFILIPADKGYKLYVLTGTSRPEVIPFSNDYIFFTDMKCNITDWRKMHSILIPTETKLNDGLEVLEIVHSHRPQEPFITPTDICTFLLYGPLYGLERFSVLSTALNKYMTYDSRTNSVIFKNAGVK